MPIIDSEMGPAYFDDTSSDSVKRFEHFYQTSITQAMASWSQQDIDTRFYAGGDTGLYEEIYGAQPKNQRAKYNFNRVRRVVNLIEGHQRRNRKQTVCTPIENTDEDTANQFSKMLAYLNGRENQLETVSTAFHGALITGMNLIQVYMDYTNDPVSGDIKTSCLAYNEFIIDPFFKKCDMSDCNGLSRRSYLSKRQLYALMPDRKDEIDGLVFATKDGKYNFMPETYAYQTNLYTYDEFYYRDTRKQRLLIDVQTGEAMEWRSKNDEGLNEFLQMYPQVTLITQEIPTVRMAIIVNNKLFYDGPNGICNGYPFVPVFGYFTPELPYYSQRVQGVVRGLRDAQYLYSRRLTAEMAIVESMLNSGYIFKEGALVDPNDVFQTGEGGGIALKDSAQMTDVQQIQAPQIPPSFFQLSESLANEINNISGVNEELLGSANDDKAGILSQLRQGAGLTTLQILFDQLDLSQKLLGELNIEAIQNNYTPGKVQRIIEEPPSQAFYNKNFGKYDCVIENGVLTETQRQLAFAQMVALREMGVNIPDTVLIENISIQNKKQIRDSMEQENKARQQAEQQASEVQQQLQLQQAQLANARVTEQLALGEERLTRASSNLALAQERRTASIKDMEQAKLATLRQISEMEELDLSKIERLLAMAKMLEEPEVEASKVASKPKTSKPKKSPISAIRERK
jgi:beta-phosphoglucomutase-like phosphatase (HAD superfamily)